MDALNILEYIYCPVEINETGYHRCSVSNVPHKEYMHEHDYCEVVLIRSGKFSVMTEDMHTLSEGPCLELFRKNSRHAQFDHSNTAYERYLLRLNQRIPSELESLVSTVNHCAVKSVTLIPLPMYRINWLYAVMDHLRYMLEEEHVRVTEEQFLIPLRCLLEEIAALCKNQPKLPLRFCETNILYVLTYIKEHLTEKITVDTVAAYMHCGKTKLSTDFKKYTSMSIHQYIIKERLELSLKYLESEYTLSDIAVLCGFKDSSHYIHTFQKHYGFSPSQYRRRE